MPTMRRNCVMRKAKRRQAFQEEGAICAKARRGALFSVRLEKKERRPVVRYEATKRGRSWTLRGFTCRGEWTVEAKSRCQTESLSSLFFFLKIDPLQTHLTADGASCKARMLDASFISFLRAVPGRADRLCLDSAHSFTWVKLRLPQKIQDTQVNLHFK